MLQLAWTYFQDEIWKQNKAACNYRTGGPLIMPKRKQAAGFRKQNQYTNKREMVISEVSIKDENILEQ